MRGTSSIISTPIGAYRPPYRSQFFFKTIGVSRLLEIVSAMLVACIWRQWCSTPFFQNSMRHQREQNEELLAVLKKEDQRMMIDVSISLL